MAAEAYKVLFQSNPAATTLTDVYTVPALTSTVVSTITACNQSSTVTAHVRISIAVAGAVDTAKQYIVFDEPVPTDDTLVITVGITLATTDVLRVQADTANVSFNAFGTEIT